MSQEVLNAQQWLNSTYGSNPQYIHVEETGYPGTATSYALVSAMQIELGLETVTGIFGNATTAACDAQPLVMGSTGNRVKIIQHGFYCKGYNPNDTDGTFNSNTENALVAIQEDAGLQGSQISTTAKGLQLKAILGIDEYKKVSRGDAKIRSMQQELNRNYLTFTGLRPCDGIYSRGTVTALILAIQAEEHMPTNVANGNFGNQTKRCCPEIPYANEQKDYNNATYSAESITQFTKLAQFLLYCVGHDTYSALPLNESKYDPGNFNGFFDDATKEALHAFQADYGLAMRDVISLDEWMGFLLSTGNPDRAGTACDCATRLTLDTAKQLYAAGFRYVGRYLTGDLVIAGTRVAKNLLRTEMSDIFKAKLRLFLIFQDPRQYYAENPDVTNIANYFTETRGYDDAEKAFSVAKTLGVPRNEIIYFAVDYDFMESQVYSRIIPYFKGINTYANSAGKIFKIGIYASRNTCSLVKEAGYSVSSFVADLSTGYSGNMGFPLPEDWAFDQICEYGIGSYPGVSISIDKNVASGKYQGFGSFIDEKNDNEWDMIRANGNAHIVIAGPNNSYPHETAKIPVYWAKIKDADGNYLAKYPMYDDIPVGSMISLRASNTNRADYSRDKIRFVYFRDKGGRLNAGYVDTDNFVLSRDQEAGKFSYYFFGRTIIWRDPDGQNVSMHTTIPPTENYRVYFLTTATTKYYNTAGIFQGTLPAGTKIELQSETVTGKSFPHLTICTAVMKPNTDAWAYLIPGESYGFVDLSFEVGSMPNNMNFITGINT